MINDVLLLITCWFPTPWMSSAWTIWTNCYTIVMVLVVLSLGPASRHYIYIHTCRDCPALYWSYSPPASRVITILQELGASDPSIQPFLYVILIYRKCSHSIFVIKMNLVSISRTKVLSTHNHKVQISVVFSYFKSPGNNLTFN